MDRTAIANAHDRARHRADRPVTSRPDRRPVDPALAAMVLVWTLGEIIASPVSSAFVADRLPEHTPRAPTRPPLGVMFALGAVVGPTIGTLTYEFSPDVSCGSAAASRACSPPPWPWLPAAIRPRSWRLTLPGRSG